MNELKQKFTIQWTIEQENIYKELAKIFSNSDLEFKSIFGYIENIETKMKTAPLYAKEKASEDLLISFLSSIETIRKKLKSMDDKMEEFYNIVKGIYDYTVSQDGEEIIKENNQIDENIIQKALNNTLSEEDYMKIQKQLTFNNNDPKIWNENFEKTNNLLEQLKNLNNQAVEKQIKNNKKCY